VIVGAVMGAVGGTVGGLIGHSSRMTVWEGASDARPRRVTLAPRLDAGSVGFRVAIQH
jgi:hypothetical protein